MTVDRPEPLSDVEVLEMLCEKCKVEMTKTNTDYRYKESGLDHIILSGLPAFKCPRCGDIYPIIPNIKKLHELIANALVNKTSRLSVKEFVFLRKELRIKAVDFAQMLGVHKVTVSRWENKQGPINPTYDRFIRLLYKNSMFELKCRTARPEIMKLKNLVGDASTIEEIISLCDVPEINLKNIGNKNINAPISIPFTQPVGPPSR